MRLGALALGLLASAAAASAAVGPPLPVVGAGVGALVASDGTSSCEGVPFTAEVLFLPDGHALVHLAWAGAAECVLRTGGALYGATARYDPAGSPPLAAQPQCTGSPSEGATCPGARVGPFAGPGSLVEVRAFVGDAVFAGAFVGV